MQVPSHMGKDWTPESGVNSVAELSSDKVQAPTAKRTRLRKMERRIELNLKSVTPWPQEMKIEMSQ